MDDTWVVLRSAAPVRPPVSTGRENSENPLSGRCVTSFFVSRPYSPTGPRYLGPSSRNQTGPSGPSTEHPRRSRDTRSIRSVQPPVVRHRRLRRRSRRPRPTKERKVPLDLDVFGTLTTQNTRHRRGWGGEQYRVLNDLVPTRSRDEDPSHSAPQSFPVSIGSVCLRRVVQTVPRAGRSVVD